MNLISIIIPTTRPENETLGSFFTFKVPKGWDLEYIFIIDDPSKDLDNLESLIKKFPKYDINIVKNPENLGVSASRNIGIDNSKGDFILTLDDDCILNSNLIEEYIRAYNEDPDHPGYIGLTSAPDPQTSFEKAICLSDMRYFFEIALHKEHFYWGITANLFLKRSAIGDIRFSSEHPKKGGGEDIDFCLRILRNYNGHHSTNIINRKNTKKFKCVPEAEVEHPFWDENLKGYKRFYRWGYGDVILHNNHPDHRFHQFPNLIEFSFVSLLFILLIYGFIIPFNNILIRLQVGLIFISLCFCFYFTWESTCEALKLKHNKRRFTFIPLVKAVIIRQLNDLGRFIHQFPKI